MSQLITLFTCDSCEQIFEEPTDMIQVDKCIDCYEDNSLLAQLYLPDFESECSS